MGTGRRALFCTRCGNGKQGFVLHKVWGRKEEFCFTQGVGTGRRVLFCIRYGNGKKSFVLHKVWEREAELLLAHGVGTGIADTFHYHTQRRTF